MYLFAMNSSVDGIDYLGLVGGNWNQSDTYESHLLSQDEHQVYGGTVAPQKLDANTCHCPKDPDRPCKYNLRCTLSLEVFIRMEFKTAEKWKKVYGSSPADPFYELWDSLSINQRYAKVLSHEQAHVEHFKAWYFKTIKRWDSFEQLVYPSESECNERARLLTSEAAASYTSLRDFEYSY